jgi:hypothetical protein
VQDAGQVPARRREEQLRRIVAIKPRRARST